MGCPLKHRQMLDLLGDCRNELDCRCSGPDHADALAGEVDIVIPARRVQRGPGEVADTPNIGCLRLGEDAEPRDDCRLFTLGRGALAGQAVLSRPVGASEQDTGLVVLVVSVAAPGPFDVFDGGVRRFGASVGDPGGIG